MNLRMYMYVLKAEEGSSNRRVPAWMRAPSVSQSDKHLIDFFDVERGCVMGPAVTASCTQASEKRECILLSMRMNSQDVVEDTVIDWTRE